MYVVIDQCPWCIAWTLYDWIILRLKFVVFAVVLVIVITVILMRFYCVSLIINWSVIFYECNCFYLTVSENDIIKLLNQYVSIGSGNGLVPNRRQAITWTNAHTVHWRIYAPVGHELTYSTTICKLVDLIPALHQSDCRIPNWVSAKTVLSCSTNHGQTTARFRSFFR